MAPFPSKAKIGSIDFTPATFSTATRLIATVVSNSNADSTETGTSIHFANAYNIALAENDKNYQTLMNKGDLVFTDGVPVVWAGKKLHPTQDWERVYGPDVTEWVLGDSTINATAKHYFLGSTQETMTALLSQVTRKFPAAEIVGFDCPPFHAPTEYELQVRDQKIKESGATIVWVGLGTPKQDYETQRLARTLPVTALAVGAAFDFLAGTVQQAPDWAQKAGLEWAYRLTKEPKRLARRYFWGNPQFIKSVVKHRS